VVVKKAAGAAGSGAGGFLGGLFNNPGIVVLGALGIALLFFAGDIRKAFGSLGESIGGGLGNINITLPEIKFPEFPAFPAFPEIKFPDFKFPDIFGGNGLEIPQPQKMVEDTGLLPDPTICACGSSIVQDAFGNVNQVCKSCGTPEPFRDAAIFAEDFPETFVPQGTGLTPQEETGLLQGESVILGSDRPPDTPIPIGLPEGFDFFLANPDRPGLFGGTGFVGAQINPTPIGNLSLSQIIDKFMVTASQAANIKAIAKDDFGDFDFGTNTGAGIGSIIPSISSLIGGGDLNVSQSQFEGLSAQEIANILTGGNIQNF